MALHGEIKVNNTVIGSWEAVRNEDQLAGLNSYACKVWIEELGREPRFDRFTIWHGYNDGALSLAHKVLQCALRRRDG